MNVRLHIERLVLDGFALDLRERSLLHASFEAELSRLLSVGGLSPDLRSGVAVPSLQAPGLHTAPDATPSQLGAALAQSVYGGLGE